MAGGGHLLRVAGLATAEGWHEGFELIMSRYKGRRALNRHRGLDTQELLASGAQRGVRRSGSLELSSPRVPSFGQLSDQTNSPQ